MIALLSAFLLAAAAPDEPRKPVSPLSEMPAKFTPSMVDLDHERREVMIPMRDGTRLFTVILLPKGARGAPMLLTRTPYDAYAMTRKRGSVHLGPLLEGYDNATDVIVEGGYIRVIQDVRGKHRSEGDYVMNRPLRGKWNPTDVDHATDTWDTIDWLVKNVPESNGRVGILGISYDGFTPLMGLVDPHPALKVAVPMNPMVDGWTGDDWFHHGAFRLAPTLPYVYEQEADRRSEIKYPFSHHDDYENYLIGSAGEIGRRRGMEQLGFWRKLVEHPAYDAFWQDQAMDRLLGARQLKIPVLVVHGLWDQEDIYGAPAVYAALEKQDPANDRVFLVIGPWYHGQQIDDGTSLGPILFASDTALWFRQEVLRPFLDRYLKEGLPPPQIAPVTAFETGTNVWRRLPAWPAGCDGGCKVSPTPLFLGAGHRASFSAPSRSDAAFDEWVSDPEKPVPYRARPVLSDEKHWKPWLVSDQREASGRTDVVSFVSEPLRDALKIAGFPVVNLIASTSGTDSDWVVKLIDVYPDEVFDQPEMGGYQLMISADILRGRYRERVDRPAPLPAGKAVLYRWELPTANHVFLPGHRLMVQVQSSWFPLYDRNPQTFVDNIFWAKPADYRKATQRVFHAPGQASFIELPVVKP